MPYGPDRTLSGAARDSIANLIINFVESASPMRPRLRRKRAADDQHFAVTSFDSIVVFAVRTHAQSSGTGKPYTTFNQLYTIEYLSVNSTGCRR